MDVPTQAVASAARALAPVAPIGRLRLALDIALAFEFVVLLLTWG